MFGRNTLYKGRSNYGSYKIVETVYDGRKARVLYGDANTPQSGVALDGDPELLFNYNQRFLEMIESARPEKVLVIGGGVMMLPIAVHQLYPGTQVDVVEIDPLLTELSYEYFDAPQDDRLRVFNQDGRMYLESTPDRYDMIIVDAFSGFDIPAHLLERTAVSLYRKHLNKGGVLAINAISRIKTHKRRFAKEVFATIAEEFTNLALFQADSEYPLAEDQNVIIVASLEPIELDYVQSIDVFDQL